MCLPLPITMVPGPACDIFFFLEGFDGGEFLTAVVCELKAIDNAFPTDAAPTL